MLKDLPFGVCPPGKAKYILNDTPHDNAKRWEAINGDWVDTGVPTFYVGNKDGYREEDWEKIDWENCVICLGDSATFGLAGPNEHSVPKQLENIIGKKVVNMSVPGASSELQIAIVCSLLRSVPIKDIVLCHPSMPRMWDPIGSTGNLGPWLEENDSFAPESYSLYNEWMKVEKRLTHKHFYNTITLRTLLKDTNLFEWAWHEEVANFLNLPFYQIFGHSPENLARDGVHPNININSVIARNIANAIG
jgi:hypothetical protein